MIKEIEGVSNTEKLRVVALGFLSWLFSLAVFFPLFFIPPIAVALARWDKHKTVDSWGQGATERGDIPRWLNWFSTNDERLPGGTYEPTVAEMLEKRGRFITSWYWIGVRNRGHGLRKLFSKPSTKEAFETSTSQAVTIRPDGTWLVKRKVGWVALSMGYRVYRLLDGSYIAAPTFTIKRSD